MVSKTLFFGEEQIRFLKKLKDITFSEHVRMAVTKYINEIKKTKLPHLIVDMTEIPNEKSSKDILRWIGEI